MGSSLRHSPRMPRAAVPFSVNLRNGADAGARSHGGHAGQQERQGRGQPRVVALQPPPNALISATLAVRRRPLMSSALRSLLRAAACSTITAKIVCRSRAILIGWRSSPILARPSPLRPAPRLPARGSTVRSRSSSHTSWKAVQHGLPVVGDGALPTRRPLLLSGRRADPHRRSFARVRGPSDQNRLGRLNTGCRSPSSGIRRWPRSESDGKNAAWATPICALAAATLPFRGSDVGSPARAAPRAR